MKRNPVKTITVVAAVFRQNTRVLIARRKEGKSMSGCWELPGGKVEEGEHPESALQRELWEELGIRTTIGAHFMTIEHDYPELRIRLLVYHAETEDAITQSTDHDQLVWILPKEYEQYTLAEADVPVLKKLTGLLQRG